MITDMSRPIADLAGRVFGRLTVASLHKTRDDGKNFWRCRCECGEETVARADNLVGGRTLSCGCLRLFVARQAKRARRGRLGLGMLTHYEEEYEL